jgi:flavin reductase (DIM6/NTAB) family NADH-FMN oxidoreductase RutF
MPANFVQNLEKGMEYLHKQGAFLTVKDGDIVNTMTISWGNIGYEWSRPIFTVMVRGSRYTYDLIEKSGEFTVSIPLNDGLKNALAVCGTKSGRDIDKFKEAKLGLKAGRKVETPVIEQCELHYECRIVYKQAMDPDLLKDEVKASAYKNGDYHTFYYGEIVDCYLEDK